MFLAFVGCLCRLSGTVVAFPRKLEAAFDGVYSANGFSDMDIDVGLLALRLGGRRLLYALYVRLGLPSLRTVMRSATLPELKPSRLGCPGPTVRTRVSTTCSLLTRAHPGDSA